ncbi:hypothetical protein KQX54_000879 [Cotesia glomerata]|uniref:Uncharacterized protein n=1 Tax=Cotesia glomerata TaxID=32391 RepID=A0AAV7ITN5_COTGL|nr:hypothetical protein KQX54_000879 [Cotesia glomerata]
MTHAALRKQVQRGLLKNNPVSTFIPLVMRNINIFGQRLEVSFENLKYGPKKQHQLIAKHFQFSTKTTHGEQSLATNILIYDPTFIKLISPHVDRIFVDATSKVFPKLIVRRGQLLTIMAEITNNNEIDKVPKNFFHYHKKKIIILPSLAKA